MKGKIPLMSTPNKDKMVRQLHDLLHRADVAHHVEYVLGIGYVLKVQLPSGIVASDPISGTLHIT